MDSGFKNILVKLEKSYIKLVDTLSTRDYSGNDFSPIIIPSSETVLPNCGKNLDLMLLNHKVANSEEIVTFNLMECLKKIDELVLILDTEKQNLYEKDSIN